MLGGLYSGQVALWDLRDKNSLITTDLVSQNLNAEYECKPIVSPVKDSHYDPAYSARWVHSKQATE